MDAALRDRLLGEASFMRGFAYLNLVRFWATCRCSSSRSPRWRRCARRGRRLPRCGRDRARPRGGRGQAPATYPAAEAGRPTSGAALTLLAKARLHSGSGPRGRGSRLVIRSGRYALLPNWRDNFRIATELTNAESIFELNFDGIQDAGNGSVHTLFSLPAGYPAAMRTACCSRRPHSWRRSRRTTSAGATARS
jgi:hypothetical protein